MVIAWVLYVATLLYATFWFCVDGETIEFLWYVRSLFFRDAWLDPNFIRDTMRWDVYGSRLAKLAALLILHLGAIIWLWLTVSWPIMATATAVSIGVALALPWLNERTAPCRVSAERKFFRAVLETARTLPKLQTQTLEIEGREFKYQHDDSATELFILRPSSNDTSLGDLGFFLPNNRVMMQLAEWEGFVELLEPGELPSSFEFQLFDAPQRYVHRWSVEYEPGLFYSCYSWLDDF